ncbi:MAG TPA: SDR family oxidoreductase, partial [Planctomycetaceae bacterium]|nr:SDR family oxidoreductase [Planctomycetaceae bacterium]
RRNRESLCRTRFQRRCEFPEGEPIRRGRGVGPRRSGRWSHRRVGDCGENRRDGAISLKSINVLVNNAGIFFTKPFTDYTAEDFKSLVSTNLEGFLYVTQLSIKQMLGQKTGGSIVTITASLARNPIRGVTAAVPMITKGGLETITQHLAMEYAKDGIRVNAVAPGAVYTPLHRETPKDVMESLSPMGRPSTVKDITDAVMYLTDAETVTGDILYVDGGAHFGRW